MEIGDIFVVNKADRPETDRTVQTKMALLSREWCGPGLTTVAMTGEGVADLLAAIVEHRNIRRPRRDVEGSQPWKREIVRAAEARLRAQVLDRAIATTLNELVEPRRRHARSPTAAAA